jgi:hypothetical protein
MSESRAEEARAAGLLHLTLGGSVVELPVLRIRQARAWKEQLAAVDLSAGGEDALDQPIEVMLELLAAYDVTGILGGRDAIEDRATDPEVYDAFRQLLAATFPFVATSALTADFSRLVVAAFYARASSTSGPSPAGASTPTGSRPASPTSSSSSSGTRARSA